MNIKGLFISAAAFVCVLSSAQDSSDYLARYNRLVGRVGFSGLGVETLLNTWEYADSSDINLMVAKFNYYFSKSETEKIVKTAATRYLGEKPVMSLKDSLGHTVNYFREKKYDTQLFAKAMRYINKAVATAPDRLDIADAKANALTSYEAGAPADGLRYLCSIIDRNRAKGTKWTYPGNEVNPEFFTSFIQEYCHRYYAMGTVKSFDAFRQLSEYALKYDKKNAVYLCNVGAYLLAVKKDFKTAKKTFEKVLKLDPENKVAKQNMEVIARFETAKGK